MVRTVLGIDLGGTKIAAGRYNVQTWQCEAEASASTHAKKGFPYVLKTISGLVKQLKTPTTASIGIGIPGLVTRPKGTILKLPNVPGAQGFTPAHAAVALGLPVTFENDANCFTLAESVAGAGKGHSVVVGITLGTGVGGGIVIDGKIFTGAHGYAAEIGHMLLRPGETPYPMEHPRGDAEEFLSGTAMGKRCKAAENPQEYLEGSVCSFLQPQVFEEVAWLCTSLTHLLDPSVIVFGGSAGRALGPHLATIEKELQKWMLSGVPLPKLAVAEREDAGVLGAAMIAKN
ncbi:MAG: ROK family protein [Patescibacteria group bacterium]